MPNDYINQITDTGGTTYDIRDTVKQGTIFQGAVDGTSTSTVFTATIDGITEYHDGLAVMLKNGVVTSASGFTININGLGAKPVYNNMAAASAETTIFNINYTLLLVYDSTRVAGGCWLNYRGYNSDNNTIGYQIRTNSSNLPTASALYRYRLLFTSADRTKWIPVNTTNSTSATAKKTMNTLAIDPFGDIAYYGSTSVLSANANVGATTLWRQYVFNLGYSFNTTGSALVMTYPAPVFVKCTPQSDGSAKIDEYVQALPNTADGKIYIYLGTAYSETNIELVPQHPVYYYSDSGIRFWTNPTTTHSIPSGGTSGQVLAKSSGTDYDVGWVNQSGGGGVTDVEVNGTSVVSGGVASVSSPTHLVNGSTSGSIRDVTAEAEGGGYTMGYGATAYGYDTKAMGDYSFAHGEGTIARGWSMTALGVYNEDEGSEHEIVDPTAAAFVVGNGDNNSTRSNAFKVAWNGDVHASGSIYDGNGNTLGTISAMKRTGASSGTLTLSTSYKQVNMSQTTIDVGDGLEEASSGIKCTETGLVHITAKVRVGDSFTANDYVNARVYNSTTATALLSARIRTPFQAYNSDIVMDGYASVTAGNVLILQANNETGSRGNVALPTSTLSVSYVNVGTSGGGGGSDYVISQDVIGALQDFLPDEIESEPYVVDVIDGTSTSLDDLAIAFAYIMGDIYTRLSNM